MIVAFCNYKGLLPTIDFNFEYVDLQSRNRSWTAAVISIVAIGSLASLIIGLYTRKNKQKEEIVTNNKDVVGREDDMSSICSTNE